MKNTPDRINQNREELFDIVDREDHIIGKATRQEVHGNPVLIHRVIHILIFNSAGDWYLQQRNWNKDTQPGKWDTAVGGHVDAGETYDAAAQREMEEELGIVDIKPNFLYKFFHTNEFESEMVSTYSCTWDGEFHLNPDEIMAGRFWHLAEIQEKISEGLFTPLFLEELDRHQNHVHREIMDRDKN
jgi:isopentenyldiphosphate isomerase